MSRSPAVLLVVGGLVTGLALAPVGSIPFRWLPLFLGVTLLASSAASGRERRLWASGALLTVFGIEATLTLGGTVRGVPLAPGEVLALGVGLLLVALMAEAGFGADLTTVAVTVTSIGVSYYGADKGWWHGVFLKPAAYGALLVLYGGYGLVGSGARSSRPRRRRRTRS